jgi:hypothetical protein
MAQSYTTDSGLVLIDPGTYVNVQVINNSSNSAAAGIVTLVGEADEGPDFTQEADLNQNAFGPDQISAVQQKYGTGRIVDAFREIVVAANDPAITGAVSLVKIIKTNPSVKAQAVLTRPGFGSYALLQAARAGAPGNLIKYRSEVSVAEIAPTTGSFSYVPHYSSSAVSMALRQNGGAKATISVAQVTSGPAFAALVENVTNGTLASGASQVLPLQGKNGVAIAATAINSSTLTITLSSAFASVPSIGDTVVIPATGDFGAAADSALIGGIGQNRGAYLVTAVSPGPSSSTITIKRINAPSGAPAVASVSATVVSVGENDIIDYTPISIQNKTGQDRQSTIGLSGSFTTVISGSTAVITAPAAWAAQPVVGDILKLGSTFAGLIAGFYQVTGSTSTTASISRLSNGNAGTSGSQNVASPITQGTQPFIVMKPVIDGLSKSMEVIGDLSPIAWDGASQTASAFGNQLLRSAAEYVNLFTISKDTSSASFKAGGDILLTIGCSQASATAVVGASGIDFKVGSSIIFSASFAQFKTLSQLVSYVNSQSTFSAALSASKWANVSTSQLDKGTYGLSSDLAAKPAGIKYDAQAWLNALAASQLATVANEQSGQSGLPEVTVPDQFLSGGLKAGTTSAQFVAGIDAAQGVQTNFITALISADASVDIANGETEPTSTYTIDAVNAYLNSHCILMSNEETGMNRLAVGSRSGSYVQQKQAASSLSSFRMGLAFQDVKVVSSAGTLAQYQPWMAAIVALGMQAAAGYKGIVKKKANVQAVIKPEGDFNPMSRSARKDALEAGLLILEPVPNNQGFRWVSDQMTYSVDNNFVYNSMQAVYVADLMTLTLIEAFNVAVVGQSVAQISAKGALSFLQGQMLNFLRLRWTAPSDDAPKGYKNASTQIVGPALRVSVEAKLAGLIYFVPINFTISQVQQSAS